MNDFEKFIRLANNIANFNDTKHACKWSYYFDNRLSWVKINLYDEIYIQFSTLEPYFESQCYIKIFEDKSFVIPEKGQDVIDERIVELCYFNDPKNISQIIEFILNSDMKNELAIQLLRGIE